MILDTIAALLLASGGFFCLVAGIGIVRFRDVFMRMHASTKAGTLGILQIALAMILLADTWARVVEPLFVFIFMLATIPIGSHLIGRAAFRTYQPVEPDTQADPESEGFRFDSRDADGPEATGGRIETERAPR